jgi:hypothetical protein
MALHCTLHVLLQQVRMQRAQDDADRAKAVVQKTKTAKRDEDGGWRQQQAALEQQVYAMYIAVQCASGIDYQVEQM